MPAMWWDDEEEEAYAMHANGGRSVEPDWPDTLPVTGSLEESVHADAQWEQDGEPEEDAEQE